MSGERGSVTIWLLALSMVLMVLGGLSIDLWRVLAERRLLAATADAAAVAAVSAIDLDLYRDDDPSTGAGDDGLVGLDETLAEARALESIRRSGVELSQPPDVRFDGGGTRILVAIQNEVEFGLLRLLADGLDQSFTVTATAQATATEFG